MARRGPGVNRQVAAASHARLRATASSFTVMSSGASSKVDRPAMVSSCNWCLGLTSNVTLPSASLNPNPKLPSGSMRSSRKSR